MRLELEHGGTRWRVDHRQGTELAIAMGGAGPQASFFVPGSLSIDPLVAGGFRGDTREGGSCNVSRVEFVPHCHGTHTEGIGHITDERAAVHDTIDARPCLARITTVATTSSAAADEPYHVDLEPDEPIITHAALTTALAALDPSTAAVILRVRPLQRPLPARDFLQDPLYPLLTVGAMEWLSAQPLRHLLVEMPSLDRADDGGRLGNHRLWWGLPSGRHEIDAHHPGRSITEMAAIPDRLSDGLYWLHLGLSPLRGDATPSRPLVYPLERLT